MIRSLRKLGWGKLPAIVVGMIGVLCLISGVTVVLEEFPKRPAVAPAHWWLDHWWSDLVVTCTLMLTIGTVALLLAWLLWRADCRRTDSPK